MDIQVVNMIWKNFIPKGKAAPGLLILNSPIGFFYSQNYKILRKLGLLYNCNIYGIHLGKGYWEHNSEISHNSKIRFIKAMKEFHNVEIT